MAQKYFYEAAVRNSTTSVIVPLKECIWSLNGVYEALIAASVHPITGYCSNYDHIRQQIEQASMNVRSSDQAATQCLRRLDGSLETLTRDEGMFERQKNAAQQTLDNLKTTKDSYEKLLRESKRALEEANTNLRSARDTVKRQEKRVEDAELVAAVGLGVTIIPVVGWVAGPIMVIGSAIEMEEASRAIKIAEEEVEKFESQSGKYSDKVCGHKSKISQTKIEIEDIDCRLMQIRENIHTVRKQRQLIAEFQRKTRSAVHLLSVLHGRVRVLEHQTQRFIHLESVRKVLEEVMMSAKEIAGNELLCNNDMSGVLHMMWENNRHLKAICASQNNNQDMSFLNYI